MFDSIVIRPNKAQGHPLDYGQMIENLFFYKQTIAHLGRSEIRTLFDLADVDVLVELLKLPSLSIFYNNSHAGVANSDGIQFVDTFGLSNLDLEKELYEETFRYKHNALKSKNFAKKLARLIKIYELPTDFNQVMINQLKDGVFLKQVLTETINFYQPNSKIEEEDLRYEVEFLDATNFKIHTNIEEIGIDTRYVVKDSPVLALINTCVDLFIMAENVSEISLPEFNSKLIRTKIGSVLDKTKKSKKEIKIFNHFTFNESWALREAINSKQVHIKAVLQVLNKSGKYKEWLQQLPENSNLMFEYVQKVQEKNIFETFPSKAIRFYLFNGVGAILSEIKPEVGIPFTIAVNAFNDFLLDSLLKKWNPGQFIEGELRPLIPNKNNS